jgi:hypothetical protein
MSVQIAQNVACSLRRTPQSEQCLAAQASRKSGWRRYALMPWWVELALLGLPKRFCTNRLVHNFFA